MVQQQLLRRVSDLERRLARTIRIGKVAAVQLRPYRAQVDLGDGVTTDWLHVVVERAGPSMIDYSPLDVGEGVLVLAPAGGDVMFVLPALARGRIELTPPEANGHRYVQHVADGGIEIAEALVGQTSLSGGRVIVRGTTDSDKTTVAAGDVTAATEVTAADKRLTTHVHTGVTSGGGLSGPPQ